MLVHQAFRFELDPNDRARSALASHCGASRFAYNFGLSLVKERLELRERIRLAAYKELLTDEETEQLARSVEVPWTLPSLRKEWNRRKADVAPWWAENSKEAFNSGLDALARALDAFSEVRRGERAGDIGFPRLKRKWSRRSCRFTTGAIKVVDDRHVQLPRIGKVRTKEQTTTLAALLVADQARLVSATISNEAGHWFVTFGCEVERTDAPARHPWAVAGVDVGVHHLAALSSGELVPNPKALNRYARRMGRLQHELSRRQRGSRRRQQTKAKLARCHRKIVSVRRDAIHKLTSDLASTYGMVVIEDLNVAGMTRAPKPRENCVGGFARNGRRAKARLNRAILDVSPAEFRRQLAYKLAWRAGRLVIADRFFPSSKTCSSCGETKAKLSLSRRTYRCACGLELDRDINAARNLAAYGQQQINVAGSGPETENARGGGSSGPGRSLRRSAKTAPAPADKTVTASSQGEAT